MAKIIKVSTAVVQANFEWTYVRIYTDASGGIHGTGECFFAPGLLGTLEQLGELLIGQDPCNIEYLVEKMRWAASGAGSLGGFVWNAITGIEAALWDVKGKLLGQPVWQLLGGKFREEVRIYLDCHADGALECLSPLLQPTEPHWQRAEQHPNRSRDEIIQASATRAKHMAELGYTAMKFDLDLPDTRFDSATGYTLKSKDIDWMVGLTHAIRAAIGTDVDLAMDAHWRYRASDIVQVAKELEPCRLLWLEDPVPPFDEMALRYLRQHSTTPIGTGENIQLRQGFWNLITQDLCDVITPDLQKAGGLSEGRKIADMCAAANKPFAPHMIGSPLALMASSHLALTIPNFLVCEFHAYDVPFFHELAEISTPWFKAGWVTPNDHAGFGIELSSRAAKYKLPNTRWFDE